MWMVAMELDGRYISRLSMDSVVYAMMAPEHPSCSSSDISLEIRTGESSRSRLTNRAVLKGVVTYLAEIGYMLPEPWPERAIKSCNVFIVMHMQTFAAIAVVMAGIVAFVIFFTYRRGKFGHN